MIQPRVLILRAPGTNCDEETAFAFQLAGGLPERVHINRLLESPSLTNEFQILCIPGGFSYGDDVAAGRILAGQIRHHLADFIQRYHDAEKLILGICNGFQALLKSGILLADDVARSPATLTWNESGRFEDRWVRLRTDGQRGVFLAGVEQIQLPVAHAEGRFVARDEQILSQLDEAGQLVLRYQSCASDSADATDGAETSGSADTSDGAEVAFPDNPNGSQGNVAGVCDPTGRVLGLMPHPERYLHATNHPRWTREPQKEVGDGLRLF